MSEKWEDFFVETSPPADHDTTCARLADWVKQHAAARRKTALVTSGGTTVPLERNTVRLGRFSFSQRSGCRNFCIFFLTTTVVVLWSNYWRGTRETRVRVSKQTESFFACVPVVTRRSTTE